MSEFGKTYVACSVWWLLPCEAAAASSEWCDTCCQSFSLSVYCAYSKSLCSATLSSFAALCVMLAKPDACERS